MLYVNIPGLDCVKAFPFQQPVKIRKHTRARRLPAISTGLPPKMKSINPIPGSESHKTRGTAALIKGKAEGSQSHVRVTVQRRAFVLQTGHCESVSHWSPGLKLHPLSAFMQIKPPAAACFPSPCSMRKTRSAHCLLAF